MIPARVARRAVLLLLSEDPQSVGGRQADQPRQRLRAILR